MLAPFRVHPDHLVIGERLHIGARREQPLRRRRVAALRGRQQLQARLPTPRREKACLLS